MQRMYSALREYGLSDKEARVYLAALRTGASSAGNLALEANLQRSTTYEMLTNLKNKGLISSFQKQKIFYFEAAPPQRLLSHLHEKEMRIQRVLPQLEAIKKQTLEKPSVQLFVGKEGVQTIFEDMLQEQQDYLALYNAHLFERLRHYYPTFMQHRIARGMCARVIEHFSPLTQKRKKESLSENREIRFTPICFKSNVFIYASKVAFIIINHEEIIGILIANRTVAETQQQVFEILWESAEP